MQIRRIATNDFTRSYKTHCFTALVITQCKYGCWQVCVKNCYCWIYCNSNWYQTIYILNQFLRYYMLSDRCWHFIYTETCTKLFFIPGNGFTYNAWCNHFNQNMSIMQYYKIWEETSCSNHLHIIIQFTSNICGHALNWIYINRHKELLHLMANIHILIP